MKKTVNNRGQNQEHPCCGAFDAAQIKPATSPHPIPSLRTLLWRGMRRRCPQCGEGRIFQGWLKLHDRCSVCGLQLLNNQGDLWAYLVAVDRALFIFPLIIMIYFRIYNPYSVWYYVFCFSLLAGFFLTLPHRNGMSLGVDYLIRRKHGDLSGKGASDKPTDPA